MKHLKRLFCEMICVMVLFTATTTVAYATEVKDVPVTIHITDETGAFNGTVKIDFYNAENSDLVKTLELTKGNCWGNGTGHKFEISDQYTYSMIFSGLDNVEIIDTLNRSAISNFQPQSITNDLYWSLVEKKESAETTSNTHSVNTSVTERDNVVVQNQEAEEVYRKFLDTVSFIEHDETWYDGVSGFLEQYNETTDNGKPALNAKTYSSYYVNAVQGGTTEQFFELSKFERFLWTETYTRFAAKLKENREANYGDEASFRRNVMNIPIQLMKGNNNEAVIAAYEELAMWQYAYIEENGYPFNFINNRSYVEEMDANVETLPPTETTENITTETERIQNVQDNEVTSEEKEEIKDEKGIWSDTLDILTDNALTILIIVALGIGVVILYFIKNRKNVDNK